jgi:uncharacterized protein (TIGR04222 family)
MLMLQANLLDLPGPQFLVFYIVLMIVAAIVARWIKRQLVSPPWSSAQQVNVDAYEAAYLRGGANEAVNTGIAVLVQKQLLKVSKTALTIKTTAPLPAGAHWFERAIYQAVNSPSGCTINETRRAPLIAAHTAQLAERLKQWELIPADSRWFKARLLSTLVMLAVVALGVMKVNVGLSRHRPVSFLVVLVIIAGFITLSIFKSRPTRTRLGDQALKQLQDESAALQMTARTQPDRLNSPDVALAIGLFGVSALAFADNSWTDMRTALRPFSATSSGSSGSGCGSSCSSSCSSSSCGSSCGGGCGGGCGGCGGG